MVWRFYDIMHGQWYSDVLYPTQEACREAANYYMREAQSGGKSSSSSLTRSTPVSRWGVSWKKWQSRSATSTRWPREHRLAWRGEEHVTPLRHPAG
jgi:hypothetical protein